MLILSLQIRNVDAKSPKTYNGVREINGQSDVATSDFYLSQLKIFLSKNSNAFDCRKSQAIQEERPAHQSQTGNSVNCPKRKGQHRDFKLKCKKVVYKFMKGLLDERKLKKEKSLDQEEPIYFGVSALL